MLRVMPERTQDRKLQKHDTACDAQGERRLPLRVNHFLGAAPAAQESTAAGTTQGAAYHIEHVRVYAKTNASQPSALRTAENLPCHTESIQVHDFRPPA